MTEKSFQVFFPDRKPGIDACHVFGKSLQIWPDDLPQREESGIVDTSNSDYTVRKRQISIQPDEREGHIYERLTLIKAQKTTLFMNSCVVMVPVIRSGEWVIPHKIYQIQSTVLELTGSARDKPWSFWKLTDSFVYYCNPLPVGARLDHQLTVQLLDQCPYSKIQRIDLLRSISREAGDRTWAQIHFQDDGWQSTLPKGVGGSGYELRVVPGNRVLAGKRTGDSRAFSVDYEYSNRELSIEGIGIAFNDSTACAVLTVASPFLDFTLSLSKYLVSGYARSMFGSEEETITSSRITLS